MATTCPPRRRSARSHSDVTAPRSWLTRTTVFASRPHVLERLEALLLEVGVADRERLVDEEDVERHLDRDREGEAQQHAGRVVLQLLVDEALEPGELEDRVEPFLDLALVEPDQHRIDLDVRPGAELGVEADAELDEGREPPADPHRPGVGPVDAGKHLEQGALAAAVGAHDAEELPLRDGERDVAERVVALVAHPPQRMREVLLQPRALLVRDPERLRDVDDVDRRAVDHARSARRGDSRR